MHILARICATKQLPTESLATNIGTIPKNMPTNFQLKRLKLKLDIVEKPENRSVHKLTDSNVARARRVWSKSSISCISFTRDAGPKPHIVSGFSRLRRAEKNPRGPYICIVGQAYPGPAPTLSKHTHARANSSSHHLDFGIKGLRPKAKRASVYGRARPRRSTLYWINMA